MMKPWKERWFLSLNDDEPGWLLCPGATNQWTGAIENADGVELENLWRFAVLDFEATWTFAKLMVGLHNGVTWSDAELRSQREV